MKFYCLPLLLLAACANAPANSDTDLDKAVRAYADAAWTAETTKTHASGEHPKATGEMNSIENDLKARCAKPEGKEAVRRALDNGIARFDKARQVAPPGEIERATFRMKALQGLKTRLGL